MDDQQFMMLALQQARLALALGEVPIGAVITYQNKILATGYNKVITLHDPTAHAEIQAIRNAGKSMQNYRLPDTTLYVTIEPCSMCAGAIVNARIQRVVYGAPDPRAGAAESVFNILQNSQLNHQTNITSGVLKEECQKIIQDFFKMKRFLQKKPEGAITTNGKKQ